jgi:hypothetical protein
MGAQHRGPVVTEARGERENLVRIGVGGQPRIGADGQAALGRDPVDGLDAPAPVAGNRCAGEQRVCSRRSAAGFRRAPGNPGTVARGSPSRRTPFGIV